jgi:hypothetical protein
MTSSSASKWPRTTPWQAIGEGFVEDIVTADHPHFNSPCIQGESTRALPRGLLFPMGPFATVSA